MSRAIKVEDQVYATLDQIRTKRETFSQVIERLLEARLKMFEIISVIEGVLEYQAWRQQEILEALKTRQEAGVASKEVEP